MQKEEKNYFQFHMTNEINFSKFLFPQSGQTMFVYVLHLNWFSFDCIYIYVYVNKIFRKEKMSFFKFKEAFLKISVLQVFLGKTFICILLCR